MRKSKKYKSGMTLIEIIVVLGLLGAVTAVSISAFSFGPMSFNMQANTLSNQYIVRNAIRTITRDIRKAGPEEISIESGILSVAGTTYRLDSNVLLRNSVEFMPGIESFTATRQGNKISLEVVSQANNGRSFKISTDINIRQ